MKQKRQPHHSLSEPSFPIGKIIPYITTFCRLSLYRIPDNQAPVYDYEYSELAVIIQKLIYERHPFLEYRIFELVQMNEFLNHQIAHNAVFVFVYSASLKVVFITFSAVISTSIFSRQVCHTAFFPFGASVSSFPTMIRSSRNAVYF